MYYLSESKLQVPKSDELEFEYVVERQEQQNICFGSTQSRNTSPICEKKLIKVGPGSYNLKPKVLECLHKVRSKKGVPGLANGGPRFERRVVDQTPSPTRYEVGQKWPEKIDGDAPFGIKSKIRKMVTNKHPGPGNYNHEIRKCRRTRFDDNFGKPTMIQTVEEICVSNPNDACVKCFRVCEGDYWQLNHTIYLCQRCMVEEKKLHEIYDKEQLKNFVKMRSCSYVHRHEGTTASIKLMSKWDFDKRHRLENYLDLYITC